MHHAPFSQMLPCHEWSSELQTSEDGMKMLRAAAFAMPCWEDVWAPRMVPIWHSQKGHTTDQLKTNTKMCQSVVISWLFLARSRHLVGHLTKRAKGGSVCVTTAAFVDAAFVPFGRSKVTSIRSCDSVSASWSSGSSILSHARCTHTHRVN